VACWSAIKAVAPQLITPGSSQRQALGIDYDARPTIDKQMLAKVVESIRATDVTDNDVVTIGASNR